MKYFKIPVEYSLYGTITIEADNIEDAIKKAQEDDNIPLPEGYYIDGSWQVNNDKVLINALNKDWN